MAQFPSTQWSLIQRSGSPSSRCAAFGELALGYREAILAFFRARLEASTAEDATQSFLAASYEHDWWSRADAAAGSFRGFLLLLLRRHLGHVRKRPDRQTELDAELADPGPATDQQFDARFALTLTARAVDVLRANYRARKRGPLFDRMLALLSSPSDHGDLKSAAAALGVPANTLTVELRRLRQRLREQLRSELMQLCADRETFDAEWSILEQLLGGMG